VLRRGAINVAYLKLRTRLRLRNLATCALHLGHCSNHSCSFFDVIEDWVEMDRDRGADRFRTRKGPEVAAALTQPTGSMAHVKRRRIEQECGLMNYHSHGRQNQAV
jgi:hypothetical protein